MAKIGFSKICTKKKPEPKIIKINDIDVSVIQYLPIQEKMNLIERIIAEASDTNLGIFNLVKLKIFYIIYTTETYTNINFTETMMKNIDETYDKIINNNIWDILIDNIPSKELDYLWDSVLTIAQETARYNSSILGILQMISQDYQDINFDIQKLISQVTNSKDLGLIKEISPYLLGNISEE